MDQALLRYCVTPVTWTKPGARTGASGDRVAGTVSKTVLCRIQGGQKRHISRTKGAEGQETLSTVQVIARPLCTDGTAFSPELKDKVTLPPGYDPLSPPILSLDRVLTESGAVDHWVLWL